MPTIRRCPCPEIDCRHRIAATDAVARGVRDAGWNGAVDAAIVPLTVAPADFTDPLAEELEAMKSDLERAREAVEKDLRFTF